MNPIGRLHLITDSLLQARFSHLELARMALEGGAEVIQYRRKDACTRVLLEETEAIRAICRRKGVPLIVDDRADVALFGDADGVHLGDQDLPIPLARDLLGPSRFIGGSADNAEEAVARIREGADYVGIGPVFPTSSKRDTGPLLGLDGLARAVRAADGPLIAIGGITLENAASVLETGVFGIAVLSAFVMADDPKAAAVGFRAILDGTRA
jgi:thiamine-phosphate pyrophosphorylase